MTENFRNDLMDFLETLENHLTPIDEDNPDLYFIPPWLKNEVKEFIATLEENEE